MGLTRCFKTEVFLHLLYATPLRGWSIKIMFREHDKMKVEIIFIATTSLVECSNAVPWVRERSLWAPGTSRGRAVIAMHARRPLRRRARPGRRQGGRRVSTVRRETYSRQSAASNAPRRRRTRTSPRSPSRRWGEAASSIPMRHGQPLLFVFLPRIHVVLKLGVKSRNANRIKTRSSSNLRCYHPRCVVCGAIWRVPIKLPTEVHLTELNENNNKDIFDALTTGGGVNCEIRDM